MRKNAYHTRFRLFTDEWVPEDLREFAGPEWEVSPLPSQGADTFFEGE